MEHVRTIRLVHPDAECRIRYRTATTTGEHLELIAATMREQSERSESLKGSWVASWLQGFVLDIDGPDDIGLMEVVRRAYDITELTNAISTATLLDSSLMDEVKSYFEIVFKADEYDASQAELSCECAYCRDVIDEPPANCRFRSFSHQMSVLSAYDWECVLECWDKPIWLYQMIKTRRAQRRLGEAAVYQKHRAEAEEKKKARAKNSPGAWARINDKRRKALEERERSS